MKHELRYLSEATIWKRVVAFSISCFVFSLLQIAGPGEARRCFADEGLISAAPLVPSSAPISPSQEIPSAYSTDFRNLIASPFESPIQQPLDLLHRSFTPSTAFLISPGALLFSLDSSWANTVNRRRGTYLFDAETRYFRPSLRYGFSDQVEIEIDQPVYWRGGGFTDPLIDGWHKVFQMPRGPRQFVADDTFVFEADTRSGEHYSETRDGMGLGDGLLSGKISLFQNETSALSLKLSGSIPTSRESFGQRKSDLGSALYFSHKLVDWNFFAGAGYTYFLDPWEKEILFRRQQIRGFLGTSYFFSERLTGYLGLAGGGPLLENVKRFPDYHLYLDAGLRRGIGRKSFLSFLIRENPAPSQGTTDIEFQFGIAQLY